MARYKVGICGHFGGNKEFLDGQTVKTKSVTEQLRKELGESQVLTEDTYGGIRVLPKCLYALFSMLIHCDNIIILPAHNSVKIFSPFLVILNRLFRKRLHYIVIGGWLPEMVTKRKWLAFFLKRMDGIYVETSTMSQALSSKGFQNVIILPNFKDIPILAEKELVYSQQEPYKLCTFSRVMQKKGIEDIIQVISEINQEKNRTVFLLDIYGQIDCGYENDFKRLINANSEFVFYRGCVPASESVSVIKDYFMLVFPTRFYTEGIPGTIIDAYAAGVPVLASKWESFSDIIVPGVTGMGYDFENMHDLKIKLLEVIANPQSITGMKCNCLREAKKYQPEILKTILQLNNYRV
ncbi:glycosyltransferase [Oribacterium sp. HCP3S3_B9]|uniref:glycosyltransferase n=1 Tax=Oribacterium sp. HCP3S3_B9 TaxID=3438946 RepID=UPI003F89FBED